MGMVDGSDNSGAVQRAVSCSGLGSVTGYIKLANAQIGERNRKQYIYGSKWKMEGTHVSNSTSTMDTEIKLAH